MSFEPTKVIEMDQGKQIGSTMIETAENIPYGSTTVGAELARLNSNLTDKVSVMRHNFTATSSGDWYKDTVESVSVAGKTAVGVVGIAPYNNNYIFESYQVQNNTFYATIINRSGNNITSDVTYNVDILYLKN